MNWKYAFATLIVLFGYDFVHSQQIPSTTTAAELWNPWTWFWPYAIASAEGFRDYYQKAQKATNELYQQAYKTNAFPWITGNLEGNPSQAGQGGNGGQNGQGGNGGQQEGQTNQDGGGDQTTRGDNATTEQSVPENQTENSGTGAQVEGNVNDDGTGNAEISGQV